MYGTTSPASVSMRRTPQRTPASPASKTSTLKPSQLKVAKVFIPKSSKTVQQRSRPSLNMSNISSCQSLLDTFSVQSSVHQRYTFDGQAWKAKSLRRKGRRRLDEG